MQHKLTRITALMLAVIMSFSMLLVPVEAASFTDVPEKAWYAAAVDYVSEKGWMNGVGEMSFAPSMNVTRAMFVTLLAAYAEADVDNSTAVFDDTAAGKWYTGSAAWASEMGIVSGIGGGRFAPNRAITRQDLCTMLYKYLQAARIELKADADRTYADFDSVSNYAKEAVGFCAASGLVTGFEDSSFRPKSTATRAQVAQILMRLDQLRKGQELPEDPMPAQSFDGEADNGMNVSVTAPEGALPEDTVMNVSAIYDETVLATLRAKSRTNNIFAATDISFYKNGEELEPQTEVEVELSADILDQLQNPAVVHMNDKGNLEFVSSEMVSTNRGGGKALRFHARDFSIYAVVDEESPDPRVKVRFLDAQYNTDGSYDLVECYSIYITEHDVTNTDGPVVNGNATAVNYLPNIIIDPNTSTPTGNYLFAGWTFNENYTDEDADELVDGAHTISYVQDELYKYLKGEPNDIPDAPPIEEIKEGEEINVYPIIYHFYTLSYLDEMGEATLAAQAIYTRANSFTTRVNYTSYEPYHAGYELNGWLRLDNNQVMQNGDTITFSQNTALRAQVVKGVWINFIEKPSETYKGARYQAPVFCPENVVPVFTDENKPFSALPGYQFIGWFENYTPAEGSTPESWSNEFDFTQPHTLPEGSEGLTLYAKFERNTTATVTINLWKQSVSDNKNATINGDSANNIPKKSYDYVLSKKLTEQTVGASVSTIDISQFLGLNDSTLTYDGKEYLFKHFHYRTDPDNPGADVGTVASSTEIMPDNSTVINIYYDRDLMTLNFYDYEVVTRSTALSAVRTAGAWDGAVGSHYSGDLYYYVYEDSDSSGNYRANLITYYGSNYSTYYYTFYKFVRSPSTSATIFGVVDNVLYRLSYSSTTGYWQYYKDNQWIDLKDYIGFLEIEDYYSISSGTIVKAKFWKSMQGLYEQEYSMYPGYEFPTKNSYNETARYKYDNFPCLTFAAAVRTFDANYNLYGLPMAAQTEALHYLENIEGDGYLEPLHNDPGNAGEGWRYENYTGFTGKEYRIRTSARTTYYIATYRNGSWTFSSAKQTDSSGYSEWVERPAEGSVYIWPYNNTSSDGTPKMRMYDQGMEIRYSRNSYNLTYFYGSFQDGEKKPVAMAEYQGMEFEQIGGIKYQKNLAEFEDDVIATSPVEGYTFSGWFKDEACTEPFVFNKESMDVGGRRVYAQFTKTQYRVFLDANLTDDETLYQWPQVNGEDIVVWNNRTQEKNFRVDYNGLVSNGVEINGEREGYALVGWYLDPECTVAFNFATSITPQTMDDGNGGSYLLDYNQNTDFTDPGNQNSDKNNGRTWVEKKLILYAKWRKVLDAKGIHVVYLANHVPGEDQYHGSFSADPQDTEYEDDRIYSDGALVITRGPSIPAAENWQFYRWELMRPDPNVTIDAEHPFDPATLLPTNELFHAGEDFHIDKDDAVVVRRNNGSGGNAIPVEPTSATIHLNGDQPAALRGATPGNPNPVQATNNVFTDGFSGSLSQDTYNASGWFSYIRQGGAWTRNSSGRSGYCARVEYSSSQNNSYLISPPFDISSNATALTVSLYEKVYSSTYPETYEVFFVKSSDITNRTSVANATKYYAISSTTTSKTSWTNRTGSVSSGDAASLAGTSVRLVIRSTSNNKWYLYIDDITVTETTSDSFTVTFVDYDGTDLAPTNDAFDHQTINGSGTAQRPSVDPTREGYSFVCWRKDGTYADMYDFSANVTGNLTLKACYAKNIGEQDIWVPYNESSIDTSKEYLIGIRDGSNVYLVVNYNPYAPSPYYTGTSSTSGTSTVERYMAFAADASLNGENVVGASIVNNAGSTAIDLDYCIWKFSTAAGGTIQSNLESGKYLVMQSSTSGSTTTYETSVEPSGSDFTYSASAKTLSANGGYGTFSTLSLNDTTAYGHGARAFSMAASAPGTSIQLYAKRETRTINFFPNGGNGSMQPMVVQYNTETSLTPNSFTRTGYNFVGWNTEADGSGTDYANGATFTVTENLDLYAQWADASINIFKLVSRPVDDVPYVIVQNSTISGGQGYALSGTELVGSNSGNYLQGIAVNVSSDNLITLTDSAAENLLWTPATVSENSYSWMHNLTGKYLGQNSSEFLALIDQSDYDWTYGSSREFNNHRDTEAYYYLSYTASGNSLTNYYTVGKNMEAINLYAPAHNFTVNYVVDGGEVEPPVAQKTQLVAQGEQYTFTTDVLEGYTPDKSSVTWTMGDADYSVTVTYTKNPDQPVVEEMWYPTDAIVVGQEYLIGYEDDQGRVFLLMNFNPNYPDDQTPHFCDVSSYFSYAVEAEVDANGHVVGIKKDVYEDAAFAHVTWSFVANGAYYRIRSENENEYYLRSNMQSFNDCYPVASDSYGNWIWDGETGNLGYYFNKTTTKYLSFLSSAGEFHNLFETKPTADGMSHIKLYSKSPNYVVTFYDPMNNNTVLKKEVVPEGHNAKAPTDLPVYVGYLFTGWDKSYDHVTHDLDVYAQYQKVDDFTVTFMGYTDAETGEPRPLVVYVPANGLVTRPAVDPVNEDGYEFKQWQLSGIRFDFNTPITANIILYPTFKIPEETNYTVYLRAVYQEMETERRTHVTWYADNDAHYHQDSEEVVFNEALPILDPNSFTEFEKAGYVFVGWGRLNETSGQASSAEDGSISVVKEDNGKIIHYDIVFDPEQPERNVWLKYNPANPANGHPMPYFTVKIQKTVDGSLQDDWVQVTHIAANENNPYHGLYAIWKNRDTFYIVHTATGKMEAVSMKGYADGSKNDSEGTTFDLTQHLTPGTLYGGYYRAYGASDLEELKDLTKKFDVKLITNGWTKAPEGSWYDSSFDLRAAAADKTMYFEEYDASSQYVLDTNDQPTNVKFFQRADAYSKKADPNVCKGTELEPVAGEIYFIKEVPITYLSSKFVYLYDTDTTEISTLYLMTVLDDNLYSKMGFKIGSGEAIPSSETVDHPKQFLARTYTIIQKGNEANGHPETTYVYSPDNFGVESGILAVSNLSDELLHVGTFTMYPSWETLDGVVVSNNPLAITVSKSTENGPIDTITYKRLGGFVGTEKIYIDATNAKSGVQNDYIPWEDANALTRVYFFKKNDNQVSPEWALAKKVDGKDHMYVVTVPAGNWDHMVLVRSNPDYNGSNYWDTDENDGNGVSKWDQTPDINIDMTVNCIENFAPWSAGNWKSYQG